MGIQEIHYRKINRDQHYLTGTGEARYLSIAFIRSCSPNYTRRHAELRVIASTVGRRRWAHASPSEGRRMSYERHARKTGRVLRRAGQLSCRSARPASFARRVTRDRGRSPFDDLRGKGGLPGRRRLWTDVDRRTRWPHHSGDDPGGLRKGLAAGLHRRQWASRLHFRVAGVIRYTSTRPIIRNPYITIAGQTAPGGGILITHNGRPDRLHAPRHQEYARRHRPLHPRTARSSRRAARIEQRDRDREQPTGHDRPCQHVVDARREFERSGPE